jgi:hypothetical protein
MRGPAVARDVSGSSEAAHGPFDAPRPNRLP